MRGRVMDVIGKVGKRVERVDAFGGAALAGGGVFGGDVDRRGWKGRSLEIQSWWGGDGAVVVEDFWPCRRLEIIGGSGPVWIDIHAVLASV